MVTRYSEATKEEIRKEVAHDVANQVRINRAYKIARHVDEGLLTRAVLNQYKQYESNIKRTVTTDDDAVEKNRGTYGSGFHQAEIPLEKPLAQIYYDAYGKGLDGSDCPSGVNEQYRCPFCGTQFQMSPKFLPDYCPCGHITPMGELKRDGFWKRI